MNARHRVIAICAVVALAGAGVSLAQEDNVLQRYDLALENLQFAIDSVPGDGVQARDELERALNALLTLSRDATSVNLVQAMERTFERARTAVENQSRTDLAVQAAVLRGGFRRLVMDSAFTAATAGQTDVARGRLMHLAADMSFQQAATEALGAAPTSDAMRLAFEAGVADVIATELAVADRLIASDRNAAYVSLATAYGDSLLIQDSPRADAGLNQSLLSAAQALVNGADEAVAEATSTASAQLSRLAAAARAGEAGRQAPLPADAEQPAPSDTASDRAAGQDAPTVGDATVSPAPTNEPQSPAAGQGAEAAQATTGAEPGAVGELPDIAGATAPVEGAGQASTTGQDASGQAAAPQGAAGQDAAGLPLTSDGQAPAAPGALGPASEIATLGDEQSLALATAALRQQERDAALDKLSGELRSAGVSEARAQSLATSLFDAGYSSPAEAVDALGSSVTSAIAALRAGDTAAARADVADVARTYAGPVAELVQARDSAVAGDTQVLLDSLQSRPALRAHDLDLLASQVDALDRAIAGQPQAAGHGVELAVDTYWSGWTRLIVLVVLAVLAFVPLRYLNLAFGGGNANWRLVAWALFLLLVPLVYEGLAALGSILADLLEMPGLDVLASWSMFTSTTGQVVWALLLFIALLLATIGLRGICRQFGLLGGASTVGVGAASANPTLVDMTRSTKPSAVDWDDEF